MNSRTRMGIEVGMRELRVPLYQMVAVMYFLTPLIWVIGADPIIWMEVTVAMMLLGVIAPPLVTLVLNLVDGLVDLYQYLRSRLWRR